MSSEFSRIRPDAGDDASEVRPGDIVTSRAPLEPGRDRMQAPAPAPPPAPTPPRRRRALYVTEWPEWVLVTVLSTIFLGFGTAILMDKEGRELPRSLATAPLLISELHPNIADVVERAPDDGALQITLVEKSPMYPASLVVGVANDAMVVLRRMHEFFPHVENRVVRFVVKAPLHPADAGSNGLGPVLALDFGRDEVLEKVVRPDFTYQDLLNMASAVHYPNDVSGPRYVAAFCRDSLSQSASIFCERAGRGE